MSNAFDDRIIKLGIELESGITEFEGLYISARGTRFASDLLNECEVVIYNLTSDQRNYLLTQTSPFAQPRTAKLMTLDVGRKSYGTFRLYQGNIIAANPTQPPDIGVVLRGLTGAFLLGNIIPINQSALSKLSTISKAVAQNTNTKLEFHAAEKNIENFSYTGGATNQVKKLGETGGINAFIDNDTLVVINQGEARPGQSRLINKNTGMVGIPEVDEKGVYVKVMMDNSLQLGGRITVESDINPAANGDFRINRMEFEVANRENPFWYNIYAQRDSLIGPQYKTLS